MENFNIVSEKENPLFKRKEVVFTVDANITPSNAETGKFISEKFSAPIEAIKIKNILGKFGSKTFTISTNIYSSKEDKESIERKRKKDQALIPKEEPKPEVSEEPTQEAESKEEKPTEENKSEDEAEGK